MMKKIIKNKQQSSQIDYKQKIVDELHAPARKNFKRRKVIVRGLNDLFQCDLVEMIPYAKQNKGFKYILVVINVFSKFVWALPIKNKTSKDVTQAIKTILIKPNIPKNLQTDMGKEFYNKDFKSLMDKLNINHYSTYSTKKASVVERVNRTLKSLMWKEFSYQGSYKWLELLPKIVTKYNSTKHGTTKMKPIDVNVKNEKNLLESSVFSNIKMFTLNNKFKINDKVRISKYREAFSKGYTPNWSNEIFTVKQVKLTNPATYILEDQFGEPILGGFYEYELQKAKFPDVHLVEKILRRKGTKVYVKWFGLNEKSWINKKDLL